MLTTLIEFYKHYPSFLLKLKGIRRDTLAPDLLEELDFHGERQCEILNLAQVYLLDEPSQVMLQGLSSQMKKDGLDSMFSNIQLPFPAMLLTVPASPDGTRPLALITQDQGSLYTQVFHESPDGFLPNLLVFRSQGATVDRIPSPTLSLTKAIGENLSEDAVVEQEQPLCFGFLSIVIGMSILFQHKAMLETKEVPLFSRPERRRAQKSGKPLPDMRIVKVSLGELGKRQLQAMNEETDADGGHSERSRRRAHWVQGHFMRNRAGGISWRNPHIRGAGPVIEQERHVSIANEVQK